MAPSLGCSSIPKVATGEEVKAQLERGKERGEEEKYRERRSTQWQSSRQCA
jgi:hypothetical protein